jgi:hypothetical protein
MDTILKRRKSVKKKYLIKFIIIVIIGYPILFFIGWITDLSYKEMPNDYWVGILVADIFASILYCFLEFRHSVKKAKDNNKL